MRVLVTGGSGFLGSALIRRLQEKGHVAIGFSRRRTSNGIVGDITNPASISQAIEEFQPELIALPWFVAMAAAVGDPIR